MYKGIKEKYESEQHADFPASHHEFFAFQEYNVAIRFINNFNKINETITKYLENNEVIDNVNTIFSNRDASSVDYPNSSPKG